MKRLLEDLAEIEHEQWSEGFAKPLSKEEPNLSHERLKRWSALCSTPYHALPEEEKEKDRMWARKVLWCMAERVPATQMNPSRVETFLKWSALCLLAVTGFCMIFMFSSTWNPFWHPVLSPFIGNLYFVTLFGTLIAASAYLHALGKRDSYNKQVLFLRKFLEIDHLEEDMP